MVARVVRGAVEVAGVGAEVTGMGAEVAGACAAGALWELPYGIMGAPSEKTFISVDTRRILAAAA